MVKEKIKIIHNLFIPWVFEDYDEHKVYKAWNSGEKIEDFAISIAGLIPIKHITNWKDIEHYWGKEWDDSYIEIPLPDTLEIEWVKGREE
tara:strand:- start:4 stop:273 length:270 start_codon:yes stop_codon:yes gene_type:complete